MNITCIALEDEFYAKVHLEACIVKTPFLELKGSFENALSAWEYLKNENIDLVISDIAMPDITGVAFLKNLSNPPLFIFVTANTEFAAESYELNVVDYVVKPYDYARFLKAATKAQNRLNNGQSHPTIMDFVSVRDGYKNIIIRFSEIFFVEGSKEYVTVYTAEKNILFRKSLIQMEQILPSEKFLRVQKSYIVNLDFVREVTTSKIIMKGGLQNIPVGPQYRPELFRRFGLE
ncbi:DNA-binding response regulator [Parapedobacter pyrenivorans]|uniref:DNA-binding response regulator n=1 Tax=Parapedobacter pyrenivorans TaxID=1305674 RepID=A0A917HBB8_9SPHI|nr:LytTR family DNA-binding domain-containing protein [Parapedobacter pyrenivorans]GGG73770.1 DNA-binding response regulator [Parapedobacter pyrenivorans]